MKKLNHDKITKLKEEELNSAIENSFDGIFITDGEANVLKINKAYEKITGFKREDMLGKNMKEFVEKKIISQSATLFVLKSKKTETIVQEFPSGKKVMSSGSPIFNEEGKIVMVVTNVRDVTQLYELKEELDKNKKLNEKYYTEIEELRAQFLYLSDIIAADENMLKVIQITKRVAAVDTTVLILGETGVGKEEIAKYIYKNSFRKKGQFIKVNCGSIPQNLMESELFGYEKGAFTGANKEGKIGLFELASGGTIFLDEVGELPLDMQVKLLRVLEEREIERVGGVKPIKIDVRIIAATNRDLEEMVRNKQYREDLYYRLNVVPLTIPPLRDRKQDILPLITYFLGELNNKFNTNKSFSTTALNRLYEYNWPGNVRQLKNIVERVMVMSENNRITTVDLPKEISQSPENSYLNDNCESKTLKEALGNIEEKMINEAFLKYGNVRAAAKSLGIDSSTFVRKRQKYKSLS
ncbi:sigma 54-interacting transcriptional regulator [Clostridium sp. CS001]|uniref:sigma-54 interaction domain-containing protein n=1 Tax=Clostridium sp. CS001 TaxID=2880648 RepID=UPI001CF11096|nr:sigma 54-interacting transcriptional regulator [Clostridium sp. CS001]MCB2291753.1 sigma 54-interacting transcriptional regulator [Clostridium sp. CS001]